MQLSKSGLDDCLSKDLDLRKVFYQQMAINVTQRLQRVSKSTADIKEVAAAHSDLCARAWPCGACVMSLGVGEGWSKGSGCVGWHSFLLVGLGRAGRTTRHQPTASALSLRTTPRSGPFESFRSKPYSQAPRGMAQPDNSVTKSSCVDAGRSAPGSL